MENIRRGTVDKLIKLMHRNCDSVIKNDGYYPKNKNNFM